MEKIKNFIDKYQRYIYIVLNGIER
jgi:hypothetical protein